MTHWCSTYGRVVNSIYANSLVAQVVKYLSCAETLIEGIEFVCEYLAEQNK